MPSFAQNLKLYQICYEGESSKPIHPLLNCYTNKNINHLFENQVILDLRTECDVNDYFGVISTNFEKKNGPLDLQISEIAQFDLYVLPGKCRQKHNVLDVARGFHGDEWISLFEIMAKNLGKSIDNLHTGIYENAVICKTKIFKDYIDNYLKPTVELFENKTTLKLYNRLWSRCQYEGKQTPEQLLVKIGVPFYTYHPFLLERLWSLYYANNEINCNF